MIDEKKLIKESGARARCCSMDVVTYVYFDLESTICIKDEHRGDKLAYLLGVID